MTLAGLQQDFREWLETGSLDRAARFGGHALPGLGVYLNNYRSNLLGSLEAAFPCTRAWLGAEEFGATARRHIMACAPTHWSIDAYPETFAGAVPCLVPHDPVAGELASLELAVGNAFSAPDRNALTRPMLAELDWETVRLTHAAGGQVLLHGTNAARVWSALARSLAPPPPERRPEVASILVWRSEWVPCFRELDRDEALVFAKIGSATRFTEICGLLAEGLTEHDAISRAGQLLLRWADEGSAAIVVDRPALPAAESAGHARHAPGPR